MQKRDGTMPGICPMGLQMGQGEEQKGGRKTHTDREGEKDRDRQRQGEGGRDRDTDRE